MNKRILVTLAVLGFVGLCNADALYKNSTAYPVQISAKYTGSSGAFKSEKGAQTINPGEAPIRVRTGGDIMTSATLAVDYLGDGNFVEVETKKPSLRILGANFGWWAPQEVEAKTVVDQDGTVKVALDVKGARDILQDLA